MLLKIVLVLTLIHSYKEKLASVPQAIVGLESALKIYGLTDEAPEAIHLVFLCQMFQKESYKMCSFIG